MASPKLAALELRAEERQVLEAWARRRKTAQALALRSRIVLACAAGAANTQVADAVGVSRATVAKWRSRFAADRLEGLSDEPRPGAPRTITDEQVELVITKTLEEQGPGLDTHWSTRSMAAATGMSQSAISRIWRAFELKPHLTETWKLSADPQFTMVRRAHPAQATAIRSPQRHRTRSRPAPVDQRLKQEPQVVHLDQDRGRNLRDHRRLLQTN